MFSSRKINIKISHSYMTIRSKIKGLIIGMNKRRHFIELSIYLSTQIYWFAKISFFTKCRFPNIHFSNSSSTITYKIQFSSVRGNTRLRLPTSTIDIFTQISRFSPTIISFKTYIYIASS